MKDFDLRGKDYLTREEAAHYVDLTLDEFAVTVQRLAVASFKWAGTTVYRRIDLDAVISEDMDALVKAHIDEERYSMEACRRICAALCNDVRKRAKKRGLPFDLDTTYLAGVLYMSGGFCQVSGRKMDSDFRLGSWRRPWAPSIDRVIPDRGYVKGNVRFVCVAANIAMNEWGEGVLRELAQHVVRFDPTAKGG